MLGGVESGSGWGHRVSRRRGGGKVWSKGAGGVLRRNDAVVTFIEGILKHLRKSVSKIAKAACQTTLRHDNDKLRFVLSFGRCGWGGLAGFHDQSRRTNHVLNVLRCLRAYLLSAPLSAYSPCCLRSRQS